MVIDDGSGGAAGAHGAVARAARGQGPAAADAASICLAGEDRERRADAGAGPADASGTTGDGRGAPPPPTPVTRAQHVPSGTVPAVSAPAVVRLTAPGPVAGSAAAGGAIDSWETRRATIGNSARTRRRREFRRWGMPGKVRPMHENQHGPEVLALPTSWSGPCCFAIQRAPIVVRKSIGSGWDLQVLAAPTGPRRPGTGGEIARGGASPMVLEQPAAVADLDCVRPTAASIAGLSSVELAAFEAASYGDVFDWPLTPDEVHRYLPLAATREEVDAALAPWTGGGSSIGPMASSGLAGRAGWSGAAALEASARRWPGRARAAASIAALPFVRMVAVTGIARRRSGDARRRRRPLRRHRRRSALAERAAADRRRASASRRGGIDLCPNYLLAESALELPGARPVHGPRARPDWSRSSGAATYAGCSSANAWYRDFLPNHPGRATRRLRAARTALSRVAEPVAASTMAGSARALGDATQDRPASRPAGRSDELRFDESVCKGHFEEPRPARPRGLP